MAEIQDVLKCAKDPKHTKVVKARQKVVLDQVKILKSQISELQKQKKLLQAESAHLGKIMTQARGLIIYHDVPLTVIKFKRKIIISKVGTDLDGQYKNSFSIIFDYKNIAKTMMGPNLYYPLSHQESSLPIESIKNVGYQFMSGLINIDQVKVLMKTLV